MVQGANVGSAQPQGSESLRHIGFSAGIDAAPDRSISALQASEALLYAARCEDCFALFPGSSVVEQPAVNRLVAGSNPARGAKPPLVDCDLNQAIAAARDRADCRNTANTTLPRVIIR